MELFSNKFRDVVVQALKTGRVLATIKKGRGGFIGEIKGRKDIMVFEVNLENREALLSELIKMVADSVIGVDQGAQIKQIKDS